MKINKIKDNKIVYIKIRYNRPDKNYEGWNLWIFENNREGMRVDFIGEDEKGKFTVIEVSSKISYIGFILRKSTKENEWEEKYFKDDKFIKINNKDKEIIINHSDKETKSLLEKELNNKYDKIQLNIHYYRFNQDYYNWNIWSWIKNKYGGSYNFTKDEEFGKLAKIYYKKGIHYNNEEFDSIGLVIIKSDWLDRDINYDRYINLAYANCNGLINAYIVQGDKNIYYNKGDVLKMPAIVLAKIDSLNEITFSVNSKLYKDSQIILKQSENIINFKYFINDDLLSGKIITNENLDITKYYTLEINGYKPTNLSFGKIYNEKVFEDIYHYDEYLGAIYTKEKTEFIIWAPTAKYVNLVLYGTDGYDYNSNPKEIIPMEKYKNGTWKTVKYNNLNGQYYNYIVNIDDNENEVTDPYAKAVGVNGNRAMVIDLESTNPDNWKCDIRPKLKEATKNIIYEMHIRDFSISNNSGITYKGKYNGVWQPNTTIPGTDIKTGIDHLKDLGITTIHLLPAFDYNSIDETKLDTLQYNWGYDPQNYNVPEGSYSSNPYEAHIRIKEFKEMIFNIHKSGIRVVMDVVYNHTGKTYDSNLNLAVPDYYYRQNEKGEFSNGSGCGNEIASERSMVRKMIVDSVVYWAKEYHIDGFRFDLMGLHDIDTMKEIRNKLNEIDKTIIIYGEGWTGGNSPLKEEEKALKQNIYKFERNQIAAFSDDIRDAIKGSVFNKEDTGFISGKSNLEEIIKFGIVASVSHKQIDYSKVNYLCMPWANEPYQTVTYTSAHDNYTLYDKIQISNPYSNKEQIIQMNKMAAAIILTSQGIPFIHAGDEFARTKVNLDGSLNENSYNSPDNVNQLDWERKLEYKDLYEYYKGLIKLRKSHKVFTMTKNEDIQNSINFLEKGKSFEEDNVVAYTINGDIVNDTWDNIVVIFNASHNEVKVNLPLNDWIVVVNENKAGIEKLDIIKGNTVKIPSKSSYVLVDYKSFNKKYLV